MQLIDGQPVYSATDLVGFLACEHLTTSSARRWPASSKRPMREDPELDLSRKRGLAHEQRFLDGPRGDGRTSRSIEIDATIADAGERAAARPPPRPWPPCARGDDVIYQATFFDGRWLGYADFLCASTSRATSARGATRSRTPSSPATTKGRRVLQICSYVELLDAGPGRRSRSGCTSPSAAARASGRAPPRRRLHGLLPAVARRRSRRLRRGRPSRSTRRRHVPGAGRALRRLPLERGLHGSAPAHDDDLSLVAGIAARQRRRLLEARRSPRAAASPALQLPLIRRTRRARGREALERVREQARIQVEGEERAGPLLRAARPEARREGRQLDAEPRARSSLPEPSPGDLFFDIEGDPFALDDGVDYLFGVLEPRSADADGQADVPRVLALRRERATSPWPRRSGRSSSSIDLFMDRLARDPDLHIYHYAPYEPTALGRLMGRHGTREDEVDRLLRGERLRRPVPGRAPGHPRVGRELLDQAARAAVRVHARGRPAGRRLEHRRVRGLARAGRRASGDAGRRSSARSRATTATTSSRPGACATGWRRSGRSSPRRSARPCRGPRPSPASRAPTLSEKLAARAGDGRRADRRRPRRRARAHRRSSTRAGCSAQLLSWHRREDEGRSGGGTSTSIERPTDEERVDEPEPHRRARATCGAIGPGQEVDRPSLPVPAAGARRSARSASRRRSGDRRRRLATVVALDDAAGTVDLQPRRAQHVPHPTSLVPVRLIVDDGRMQASLLRIGEWVADARDRRGRPATAPRATCSCAVRRERARRRAHRCSADRRAIRARRPSRRRRLPSTRARCRSRVRPARARPTPARR